MAGDWIKIETSICGKPEVCEISNALGIEVYETVGRLIHFWAWVDENTRDGYLRGVRKSDVDRVSGLTGFAEAVERAGWLVFDSQGVRIPNFDYHNSESAKARAKASKRQKRRRRDLNEEL